MASCLCVENTHPYPEHNYLNIGAKLVKSKCFYSLKVKYNMTSEEMEIQSCSQDGYRNFIYIITVG